MTMANQNYLLRRVRDWLTSAYGAGNFSVSGSVSRGQTTYTIQVEDRRELRPMRHNCSVTLDLLGQLDSDSLPAAGEMVVDHFRDLLSRSPDGRIHHLRAGLAIRAADWSSGSWRCQFQSDDYDEPEGLGVVTFVFSFTRVGARGDLTIAVDVTRRMVDSPQYGNADWIFRKALSRLQRQVEDGGLVAARRLRRKDRRLESMGF